MAQSRMSGRLGEQGLRWLQTALLGISSAALLVLSGCAKEIPIAEHTDRSTLNLAKLTDGEHPWLTINLLNDPTDSDLQHLRWSPNSRTLAYIEGNTLHTWNPDYTVALDGGKDWKGPYWSPDGQFVVVSCSEQTLVIDASVMVVRHRFDGDNVVWWNGPEMCYGQRQDASKHKKSEVETVVVGDHDLKLPAGLSLVAASPQSSVLLAQNNFADGSAATAGLVMLGIDAKSDQVIWIKPAPTGATTNFANPDLLWNERLQSSAQTVDNGGGFDLHAYVENGRNTAELKFAQAANYSWISGSINWLGDELFAPMTLCRVTQVSSSEHDFHFWNEIALYNATSGQLRTVSTGLPFEAAAASSDFVALVVNDFNGPKIVITPWVKDDKGNIEGITYKPNPTKPDVIEAPAKPAPPSPKDAQAAAAKRV